MDQRLSWLLATAILVVACASETDTETYGPTSSSTGPMVNSPDKDAGSDSEAP